MEPRLAGPLLGGMPGATAAEPVRGYGVTTAQLKDWSIMKNSIGVDMEFTGTDNSVGVFMRDVAGSDLGDKVDIFIFESGHRGHPRRRGALPRRSTRSTPN